MENHGVSKKFDRVFISKKWFDDNHGDDYKYQIE